MRHLYFLVNGGKTEGTMVGFMRPLRIPQNPSVHVDFSKMAEINCNVGLPTVMKQC